MGSVKNGSFGPGRHEKGRKSPKAVQDWSSVLWEIENNPDLILLAQEMEQEYQAHIAGEPCLDPQRAILFHSRRSWICNFLTAPYFRKAIRRSFQWAVEHGFTTFLADYGTPFGLLALEVFSELRETGVKFSLYAVRSVHMRQRKSYRLHRESDVSLIPLIAQCDYNYTQFPPAQTVFQIYLKLDYFCTEIGVERTQRMKTQARKGTPGPDTSWGHLLTRNRLCSASFLPGNGQNRSTL